MARGYSTFSHPIPASRVGFGPSGLVEKNTRIPYTSLFIGVQLDVMDVARGFKSLSMAYEAIPSWVIANGAKKLQSDIRFYTPIGPERSLEGNSIARQVGAKTAGVFQGGETGFESAYSSALNKIIVDLKHLGRTTFPSELTRSKMRNVFDPNAMGSMTFSAEHLVAGGLNEFSVGEAGDVAPLAKDTSLVGQGSLWNSINVATKGQRGHAQLVAWSSNYYAWFVENGFLSTYEPVPFWPHGGYRVPLSQLGKYPYFLGMILAREERAAASSSSKGKDIYSEEGGFSTTGDLVGFKKRKFPKWIKGSHMFERGFTDFALRNGLIVQEQMSRVTGKIWEEHMSAGTAVAEVFQRRDLAGRYLEGKLSKEVRGVPRG